MLRLSNDMLCTICSMNETDNPDRICDDCKGSIVHSKVIPPDDEGFL